jgi:hypothetical protein
MVACSTTVVGCMLMAAHAYRHRYATFVGPQHAACDTPQLVRGLVRLCCFVQLPAAAHLSQTGWLPVHPSTPQACMVVLQGNTRAAGGGAAAAALRGPWFGGATSAAGDPAACRHTGCTWRTKPAAGPQQQRGRYPQPHGAARSRPSAWESGRAACRHSGCMWGTKPAAGPQQQCCGLPRVNGSFRVQWHVAVRAQVGMQAACCPHTPLLSACCEASSATRPFLCHLMTMLCT